jgi:hypothetical protein
VHRGIETCRSFFIHSGIKYVVPLLVICCMQNARYTVWKTKTSAFVLNVFYNGTSPRRQMAVALLVKEFLIVYEIQWFITVGCAISWASWIQSTTLRSVSLRSILISSFHLCLCLPICPFISKFHLKSACFIYSLHSFCMFRLSHTFCLHE